MSKILSLYANDKPKKLFTKEQPKKIFLSNGQTHQIKQPEPNEIKIPENLRFVILEKNQKLFSVDESCEVKNVEIKFFKNDGGKIYMYKHTEKTLYCIASNITEACEKFVEFTNKNIQENN